MKCNVLNNEPVSEFIQQSVVKSDNVTYDVAIINKFLEKYFVEVIDDVLENGTFTISYIRFRIEKRETSSIPKSLRRYYVIPNYGAAYSYTIKIMFLERLKGVYTLRPDRKLLEMLKKKLNSSPDLKVRLYVKKTA